MPFASSIISCCVYMVSVSIHVSRGVVSTAGSSTLGLFHVFTLHLLFGAD